MMVEIASYNVPSPKLLDLDDNPPWLLTVGAIIVLFMYEMRFIAVDKPVAWASVSLSVFSCHAGELCKNGWTDRRPVWRLMGPKKHCIRWRPHSPWRREDVRCGLCQITLATCLCFMFCLLYRLPSVSRTYYLGASYAASMYCSRRRLRVCVCLYAQNLKNYSSDIDATRQEYVPRWTLEVFGSWWDLTLTFDLESYFRIFSTRAITLQWLDLANSFSVWR